MNVEGEPVVYQPLFGDFEASLPKQEKEVKQPGSGSMLKCKIPSHSNLNPFDTNPREPETKSVQPVELHEDLALLDIESAEGYSSNQTETSVHVKVYDLPLSR